MALIAVVLNGIGGRKLALRRRPQDHLSTAVTDSMRICGLEDVEVFRWRGGPLQKRKTRKHIEQHNCSENSLVCFGMSYGARNLTKVLQKIHKDDGLKYNKIGMLTVDPQWLLHNINHSTFNIPPVDYAYNFYQTNFMGGAQIQVSQASDEGWNKKLDSTHKEIDSHPKVAEGIRKLLIRMKDVA